MTTENFCSGHLAPRRNDCYDCIHDIGNTRCPDYHPIRLYNLLVVEEMIRRIDPKLKRREMLQHGEVPKEFRGVMGL